MTHRWPFFIGGISSVILGIVSFFSHMLSFVFWGHQAAWDYFSILFVLAGVYYLWSALERKIHNKVIYIAAMMQAISFLIIPFVVIYAILVMIFKINSADILQIIPFLGVPLAIILSMISLILLAIGIIRLYVRRDMSV